MTIYLKRLPRLSFVLAATLLLSCLATTNYYSGKTLPAGKKEVIAGFENLLVKEGNKKDIFDRSLPITPSLGFSFGLGNRFESGIHWFWLTAFEAFLRWEITPPRFKVFDLSANAHVGADLPFFSYLKIGTTISRQIGIFEPYANYYWYSWGNFFNTSGSVGFGVVISLHGSQIVPEVNYQIPANDDFSGLYLFNIGIKVPLKR